MSFAVDWLDLRAPADAAARDAGLLDRVRAMLAAEAAPLVVDLGAGTGATMRAVAAPGARWRLVDNDAGLLAEAARRAPGAETVLADLATPPTELFAGAALVTASALLDLVSAAWLAALVARLTAAGTPLYAALSYDGGLDWQPELAGDAMVRAGFNRHQRRDKGFGPALGPDAVPLLAELLAAAGWQVQCAPSPWRLGPGDAAVQRALVAGIAAAAEEERVAAAGWAQARLARSGTGSCTVGHVDVLARPGTSTQSKITSEASA